MKFALLAEARDYGDLAEIMLDSPEPGLAAVWLMRRAKAMNDARMTEPLADLDLTEAMATGFP